VAFRERALRCFGGASTEEHTIVGATVDVVGKSCSAGAVSNQNQLTGAQWKNFHSKLGQGPCAKGALNVILPWMVVDQHQLGHLESPADPIFVGEKYFCVGPLKEIMRRRFDVV